MLEFILKDGGRLPVRGSEQAAGLDIHSINTVTIPVLTHSLVRTGVFLNQLPRGTYLRIAPRSKLANKHGLMINGGVVDADYRGEIMVIMYNSGTSDYDVEPGDAIAQLILERYDDSEALDVTDEVAYSETKRGDSGVNSNDLRK